MPTTGSNPLNPVLPRAGNTDYVVLKYRALKEQGFKCLLCSEPGPKDLHHTFLRHSDLPGDRWDSRLGDRIENVVMLHNKCHLDRGHSKDSDIAFAKFKILQGHNLQVYFNEIRERFPWWSTSALEILP